MDKKRSVKTKENFSFLHNVDIFESPLPSFTLNGKSGAGTVFGGVISLIAIYVAFLFASNKLVHLIRRQNPTVNTYLRKDAFDNDERLSLKDQNFMMAFTLESYFSGETLDDPNYIKWLAYFRVDKDGVSDAREIPIYPCRDEDYAKFYPVDERSLPKLKKF